MIADKNRACFPHCVLGKRHPCDLRAVTVCKLFSGGVFVTSAPLHCLLSPLRCLMLKNELTCAVVGAPGRHHSFVVKHH